MSEEKKGAALNVVDFDYSVDGFNKHFKMIMAPFDFKSGDVTKVIDVRNSVVRQLTRFRDPLNRNTPGLPVHHQLPEFTQTHVHRVSDAIQPSHPLSSPSPPAPNPSQHQSLFQSQLFA